MSLNCGFLCVYDDDLDFLCSSWGFRSRLKLHVIVGKVAYGASLEVQVLQAELQPHHLFHRPGAGRDHAER